MTYPDFVACVRALAAKSGSEDVEPPGEDAYFAAEILSETIH